MATALTPLYLSGDPKIVTGTYTATDTTQGTITVRGRVVYALFMPNDGTNGSSVWQEVHSNGVSTVTVTPPGACTGKFVIAFIQE
jgi:hypothetical protein